MDISEFIFKFKTHPVLFVGAGISKRYCERAFSWDDLLKTIASALSGAERFYFELHNQSMDSNGRCSLPKLASRLSAAIDEKLQFSLRASREDLSDIEKNINDEFFNSAASGQKASRLKIWVKILLSPLEVRAEKEDEITLFQEACKNVASIVTTNYDTFIEEKLKFSPLIGNDILLSNPYQSVYKIHGCLTNPSSIILTDEDYKQFDNRYELIQAQLISLFIHNPIIFMGYGIQDENIQKLLSRIFSYVTPESELGKRVADNFLCVQFEEGSENTEVVRETLHIQQVGTQIDISLNVLKTDDFTSLYSALATLQLPVEAIHLKRVEHAFHQIKLGGEIAVKLVGDLENVDNRELVLAIGPRDRIAVSLVYQAAEAIINYFEITEEFKSGMVIIPGSVRQNMYFPAKGLVHVFPEMQKATDLVRDQSTILEKEYENIVSKGIPDYWNSELKSIDDIFKANHIYASYKRQVIFYAVRNDKIELSDLRSYLQRELVRMRDGGSGEMKNTEKTEIRKLLCLYDEKKYS